MSADDFNFEGDAADDAAPISKRELCDVTGWPPKQVDSYVRAGMPTVPGEKSRAPTRFELAACFRWFVEFTAATADPMADLKKRRAAIALAREERKDRDEAGEFYPRAAVHREIDEAMVALRNDLLTIPASLVDQPPDVRAAVKVAIVAKINALSFEHGGIDGPQS
jgi:phage terminase Nu1 subunit (DNA packaging protein)